MFSRTEGGHSARPHHLPGDLAGALQVVLSAGGHVTVDDLLGGTPAQRAGDPAMKVGGGVTVPVGLRCLEGDAEGLAPGG